MDKNRNISIAEYFFILQNEYLIADFRKKIYSNKNDKKYYQRVMDGKRDKINDISERNKLDSIFNNSYKMSEMKSNLFDKTGNPSFPITATDEKNYYSIGSDFSYKGDIWVLDQINSDGTLSLRSLLLDKNLQNVKKEDVCRIL